MLISFWIQQLLKNKPMEYCLPVLILLFRTKTHLRGAAVAVINCFLTAILALVVVVRLVIIPAARHYIRSI